jgi:hypothetical protein
MIVGTVIIRMAIHGAQSLKDKRRVVKSLKERIRNDFNVSIAEVDHLDSRQMAVLGVAVCANSTPFVEEVLSKVVNRCRLNPEAVLIDFETETFGV